MSLKFSAVLIETASEPLAGGDQCLVPWYSHLQETIH
jgi:hypothetical protein